MKKIRIDFVDFWPDLDKEHNYFTDRLRLYYDVEISKDPEYVFCSCFGRSHFRYADKVKILFVGENIVPDFNLYDYAMGFHYLDFEDRYLRLPLYALYDKETRLKPALEKHTKDRSVYLQKKGFCNFVVSNPMAAGERDEMFKALSAYKQLASGGRYRNNVGGPVKDKIAFEKEYKFTLCFENSGTSGYTTEKILEAFAGETVPIYWGNPRIREEFNPGAFIDLRQFASVDACVEYVKRVDEDEELFLSMMEAPIVTEQTEASKILKEDYADDFLRRIFDGETEGKKRRNMVYYGENYQKDMADAAKIQSSLDVVKKPVHTIKKKIRQKKQA